ncbi:Hypothetical protein NTJ_00466 [Nesidiocoris tenuis]|uniref:Uncharacterized protein n=1 Tax=Nesidiocoris tenuis TaxID=355587 RepID=A0ABN7A9Y0_9HEMI|nr:Hypothetical protein NTJ_00466 [Nesidiocoris tenuis]
MQESAKRRKPSRSQGERADGEKAQREVSQIKYRKRHLVEQGDSKQIMEFSSQRLAFRQADSVKVCDLRWAVRAVRGASVFREAAHVFLEQGSVSLFRTG